MAVFYVTQSSLQFTAQRVELLGYFPNDTEVRVSNVSKRGRVELLNTFTVTGSLDLQRVGTGYINKSVNRLKLEFDQTQDGLITLSRIKVFFPYLEEYYFTQDNVGKFFSSAQSALENARQYRGKQITVLSKQAIARPTSWAPLFLAGIFFAAAFLLARNSDLSKLPAFSDMKLGKSISSMPEFDTVNGLRGLAAILVLLSHTAPGFESINMGLALLFVISGFLLSKPFVLDQDKIFNPSYIERYFVKRLRRILPMYYLYIFLIFGISLQLETLVRHLVFIQADGHLWPMTQIFAFYMLLPAVLLVTSAGAKLNKWLPVIILIAGSILSFHWMQGWKPFYNGRFNNEFFLYTFLMGVLCSYLYYSNLTPLKSKFDHNASLAKLVGALALGFTVIAILWSAPIQPPQWIWKWVSMFWVKCILAATIILLALFASNSFYRLIIGNWLFRSVGVIGFSFYLLHGLGMELQGEIQRHMGIDVVGGHRSWPFTAGAFVITYLMALITYSYVERPFFGYKKKSK